MILRTATIALVLSALVVPTVVAEREARADDAPLGLSVSLERAAGIAYTSARPTSSTDTLTLTTFTLGGAAINPIALPRLAIDVILPMGLTLGGAVAFGHAALTDTPDQGSNSTETGTAWLISPRVGYAIHLSPLLDLTPRVGMTIAGASLTAGGGENCTSTGTAAPTCTTLPGDTTSLTLFALSLDVVAALRLTKTFNLLGGVSYDQVIAASGSSTDGVSGTSQSQQDSGKYLGVQLWFGLGGYVL